MSTQRYCSVFDLEKPDGTPALGLGIRMRQPECQLIVVFTDECYFRLTIKNYRRFSVIMDTGHAGFEEVPSLGCMSYEGTKRRYVAQHEDVLYVITAEDGSEMRISFSP